MQITKITDMPIVRTAPKRPISKDALQGEYDFWRAVRLLQKMLDGGLITQDEFNEIDRLNRKSFSPLCARLMP